MMPISNLKHRAIARLAVIGIGVLLASTLSLWWMLSPAELPPSPPPTIALASETSSTTAIQVDQWSLDLWRPLSDAPVVVATSEPPPKIRLFSILTRNGGQVAALQVGSGSGLVYVKPGEVVGKISVISIDAKGADLTYAGKPVRVEMGK
jgi:hypothetical protein